MMKQDTIVDGLLDNYEQNNSPSSPVIIIRKDNFQVELTEETVKKYSIEVLNYLIDDIRNDNDFNKRFMTLRALTELKRIWWPATQKQITTNIDLFNEQLKNWYQAEEKLNLMKRNDTNKQELVAE